MYEDLLEGVTRKALMELMRNEGIQVAERSINRSELYVADEVFVCGTGVQVSPVVEVDHRAVGSGEVGPIAGWSAIATSTRSVGACRSTSTG